MPQSSDNSSLLLSQVPSIKDLCEKLGFQEPSEKRSMDFLETTHIWRKTYQTPSEEAGADLVSWNNAATQEDLRVMAAKFLERHGGRFWPNHDGVKNEDREQIAETLKQLFWKQNKYAFNNRKYEKKRQEQTKSANLQSSLGKRPSATPGADDRTSLQTSQEKIVWDLDSTDTPVQSPRSSVEPQGRTTIPSQEHRTISGGNNTKKQKTSHDDPVDHGQARRFSDRKRTKRTLPDAVPVDRLEEALESDFEPEMTPVPTVQHKPRTPKSARVNAEEERERKSSSQKSARHTSFATNSKESQDPSLVYRSATQISRSGPVPGREDSFLRQSILTAPTSEQTAKVPVPVSPSVRPAPTNTKPVVEVRLWVVKSRTPYFSTERWKHGKFSDTNLVSFISTVSKITKQTRIEELKFTLRTCDSEFADSATRGDEAGFASLKRIFDDEIKKAFAKDRNQLKAFEIFIEPSDAENGAEDGHCEVDDAILQDY